MKGNKKGPLFAFLLIVLVAAGGGAWFVFSGTKAADETDGIPASQITKARNATSSRS